MITVSIVSHAHGRMVVRLVASLLSLPEVAQIIVTRNVPEVLDLSADPRVLLVDNPAPKGFGANHNAAFKKCRQPLFCPLNPDIELVENPFPKLIEFLSKNESVVLIAPIVLSPLGSLEDSARYFPTVSSLLRKMLSGTEGRFPLAPGQAPFSPDWVAGMFMLFNSQHYLHLGGFDERFFLYYEDVDICARARKAGMCVVVCPTVAVIHDARRDSRRNLQHLLWHLSSMARYFLKHWGRLPRSRNSRLTVT